ncbi:transcriptional regulator [Rummeliibacillus sp. NPDC094406]|uniref:transcriptional regulator n=1 Tax=Rummeliibacillus sp. NPDC094406 TaxID=3364511 RepID=UPI00380CE581
MKAMNRNQLVNIMYMSKTGEVTKRRVKIMKITDDTFKAYCFLKQAQRTFKIDRVLAIVPVIRRESEII